MEEMNSAVRRLKNIHQNLLAVICLGTDGLEPTLQNLCIHYVRKSFICPISKQNIQRSHRGSYEAWSHVYLLRSP